MLVLFFSASLGVIRWKWLLDAQGIQLRWLQVAQLTFIGSFFNIALPGAVSGDFVKAFYVGQLSKGQKSRAFGSILFDRVAGLSALILVSAGAVLIGFMSFANTRLFHAIQFILGLSALGVVFFYGYLFLVREHHDPVLRFCRSLEKKWNKLGSLVRIYESLRHYHHHRMTVIKVICLSIFIHLCLGWACWNFAAALGDSQIPLLPILVVVPLGMLLTAIPIAPAGVGTGNIAFFYFFQLIGSSRGADIFSLVALSNILLGAVGGLVYFRFRSASHPSAEELPALGLNLTER
jgi:uncharacterized protein (TIRG00374 family)